MTDTGPPPNVNALWGHVLVEELVRNGLEAACISPGSRSTPLTVAFAAHPDIEVFSHLDERSGSYFALGRGRTSDVPTAIVCTSGTAAANFHPAVIEAHQARVPLLVLTADRPHELRDSGANQTIDQVNLYGDCVRWDTELPLPEATERSVRMLRTTASRALSKSVGTPSGPVHLNCPFRKPLEPVDTGDVSESFMETLAGRGRDTDAFVTTTLGQPTLEEHDRKRVASVLADADRPLIVAGPADPPGLEAAGVIALAEALEAPVLADPLSDLRFGKHTRSSLVCGGYDAYLSADGFDPDVVVRFGASPTSKRLQTVLETVDCRQFLVDPAGDWREATFTATDLLVTEPGTFTRAVAERLEGDGSRKSESESDWLEQFKRAEDHHWNVTDAALESDRLAQDPFEGAVLASVFDHAPNPATIFVSNSMPIRDADRFAQPREADLTVLANRGASGIDGIVSTALGAGSTSDDPLVCVTGDLALYHDSNGLLALERCDVDATIVLLDNDGGGIFHMLPIESYDPPFTSQFKTPHGLDFSALEGLYDLTFERVRPTEFDEAYQTSLESPGTQLLAVDFDSEASHRRRETLEKQSRAWRERAGPNSS